MKKQKFWCGVLEAGSKTSPVAIDHNLDTGEKNTVFVYNHNKQEILKYARDLVEPKLRELSAKEKNLEDTLKKGFKEALKTIKYKVSKAPNKSDKDIPAPKEDITLKEPEIAMGEEDDDWVDTDD